MTYLIPSKSLIKSEGVRLLNVLPGITNPISGITNASSHGRQYEWKGNKEIRTYLPVQFTLKFSSHPNIRLVFFFIKPFVIE